MRMQTISIDDKDFRWRVQAGAYRWGEAISPEPLGRGQSPRSIFTGLGETSAESVRVFFPLRDHTALFKTFSETEPTESGILGFIERFGLLLAANTTPVMKTSRGSSSGKTGADVLAFHAEPYDFWRREICTMRFANMIWEMLGERDSDDLVGRFIAWRKDAAGPCAVEFNTHPRLSLDKSPPAPDVRIVETIATREEGTERFARCVKGGAVLAARLGLERMINRRLESHLEARFALNPDAQMSLRVLPKNLLQAIWLQFGLAVSEGKKYRQCAVCQTWFEVAPELARTNRRFCSISCKNREYRNRQEQARQLHGEGIEVREIAKKLETTVAIVRGWVKSDK
jgi:hypothetical protein